MLVVVASIAAASITGLNVAQVAHATDTCSVGPNSANNPTSNKQGSPATTGNPHCFDPEQQPTGTTGTGGATGTGACAAGVAVCNHPQSTNPQGTVTGNPHEEPSSGCQGVTPCKTNPQNSIVGTPHYPTR
jgi:hypothetical protein